ncbi:FadR/GntR family transcriptional regulator [Pseudonocardia sp. TRM90224]|uniref:FadR/GntR family transcriptional regulator n=1 Tax=Pseudonocardia sp. TRM90224 TaxID=2812678 RepID=UPI001E4B95D2|nr:FCD domain-containing protein [Pseudonocardia sp. TRM90224]
MSGHEPADWLGPVRVGRSVDAVTDRLVTAIAVGDFSPGERLPPERELATLLGVGRETLRAALGRLRAAGYVVTRRGRNGGAIVQDGWGALSDDAVRRTLAPSRDELVELSDTRCLVESLIARTAAERRQPEDVTAMTAALEAYEQAADAVAARRADHDLHHAVVRAARNQHLARLSRELLARVNVGLPIEPFEESTFRAVAPQHRALIEAVVAGDGDTAAAVAREHFTITTAAVHRAIDRAG